MLTLSSILALASGAIHYAWVLLLLLIPQVLNVVSPIFGAVTDGFRALVSAAWKGSAKADRNVWVLIALVGAVFFAVGYHYGWQHALDWGHEHYRWIAKKAVTSHWWKFW
jgi:hypothetical protein